jgi:hypothetical protein
MAKDAGQRTDNMPIKKIEASDFTVCRQTVVVNHYPEILQMIVPGVRL